MFSNWWSFLGGKTRTCYPSFDRNMAPFRWPTTANQSEWPSSCRWPRLTTDWKAIVKIVSAVLNTEEKSIKLTGRACRERIDRLLNKFRFCGWDQKRLAKCPKWTAPRTANAWPQTGAVCGLRFSEKKPRAKCFYCLWPHWRCHSRFGNDWSREFHLFNMQRYFRSYSIENI